MTLKILIIVAALLTVAVWLNADPQRLDLPQEPSPTPSADAACHKRSWLDERSGTICSALLCPGEPLVDMTCEPAVKK